MKCAQCGADNRSDAKFCGQCGAQLNAATMAAGAAMASVPETSVPESSHAAHESLVDEVVEKMAKEPGTTKGPGFKFAIAFLLLIMVAAVLWAYKENRSSSQMSALSLGQQRSVAPQESGPSRAPSLAEQMGTAVVPAAPTATSSGATKDQPPAAGKTAADGKRAKEVKPKVQREDEQRRKNEEARLERQAQLNREMAAKNATASSNRALSTAQEVAICERMSVFARQPCLWRACNNKWGRDGCPAYD